MKRYIFSRCVSSPPERPWSGRRVAGLFTEEVIILILMKSIPRCWPYGRWTGNPDFRGFRGGVAYIGPFLK
jgi:hypothetical protein